MKVRDEGDIWKWESVYWVHLNNKIVRKYASGCGSFKLAIEKSKSGEELASAIFETEKELDDFATLVLDDKCALSSGAVAVQILTDAIKEHAAIR